MRKIVKLKGELLIIAIISIIISWCTSVVFYSLYKINYSSNEAAYNKALEKNKEQIEFIKSEVGDSYDDSVLKENIKNIHLYHKNNRYKNLYLIDKEGNVIFKASDYAVAKFSVNDEGINIDGNEFYATNIISINDKRSVVFLNSDYFNDNNSFNLVLVVILNTFICFIILVYGRINYINIISSKVRLIAKGNLEARIPVKYKNELTNLAADVNFMAKELQNQDSKQKEFITNISHDLRTPLTTIVGYLNMIESEKYSDNNELKRYVSIVKRKSLYLKSMLEDFFCYSKLCSKDMELSKVTINLNECINQLIDGENEKFQKLDLNLEINLCSKNIYSIGDPILIARAFENLISNSEKYSKKGSTIKVSLKKGRIQNNNYAIFQVENIPNDNIKEIDVEKLFYRLYKSDSSRSKGGSGLGLAITKEIIENHNGFVKVEIINEYLQFTIALKEYVQD